MTDRSAGFQQLVQEEDSPVGLLFASHLLHLEQQIVNLGAFPARTQTAAVSDMTTDAGKQAQITTSQWKPAAQRLLPLS